jgi:hypothetical protein
MRWAMVVITHPVYRHHIRAFPKSVQLYVLYDLVDDVLKFLIALSGYVERV